MVLGINLVFDLFYCVLYQVSFISAGFNEHDSYAIRKSWTVHCIDNNSLNEHLKSNSLFFLKIR